jgi:tetratricopeptide (TPR) repeat protein
MKKTLFSIVVATFVTLSANTYAQSLADVKQMYEYGRFETAKKMATVLAASNAEANYYLGLSELGLGNIKNAKAIFEKFPTDLMNNAGTARVLFAEKKNTEAMAILTGIITKAKKKDWQSFKYAADAITYSNGVNPAKAIEWYGKAIAINQNGDTYMALGDAYMNIADGSGGGNAETNFMDAIYYKANPSYVAYRRGNLWFNAKLYDSAIANYKRCMELDPKNPLPYSNFANSYYKTNRFELAKKNMESYLALSDNTADDYFQYINILYLCKDYAGAAAKIKEITAKGIEKPYVHRISAICNYELGNNELALADINKFFAKSEKKDIISIDYKYLSKILAKTPGRESEVTENILKSIELDTAADKSESYREVAEDLKSKKDYAGAAIWYGKLIENSAEDKITNTDYYYYGFCNYASKNYAAAIPIFTTMTQKYPTEPSGFYYLATCYALKDGGTKTGSALDAYKKYAEMMGVNLEKKDNLTKAYSYIIEYYYNKKDAVNSNLYAAKLLEIDATNTYATQIIDYFKAGAKSGKTAPPATGKTPIKKK